VLLNQVLKLFFARPRPDVFPPLTVEHSYSFPSGHMMAAVSVYGFIALILWKRRQRLLALMSALLIPVVGFTRIYLGVHYPSDVVGALAVGVAWLFLVYAGYRRESNG
jgi:undecaprenyl-diphosphatase